MSASNSRTARSAGDPIPEQFRHLRINIEFLLSKNDRIQTIAVTSSKRGEGRTTAARYLAMAYAQSGKRTLLVDADLRSPSLHSFFSGAYSPGLSEYLSKQCGSRDAIAATRIDNLDLIKAGPTPPNSSELLTSPEMEQLLSELKQKYDMVIIDCSPLGYIDGKVLAAKCDGAVLVLEYGKVSRDTAQRVNEELGQLQVKLLGTVLNKCKDARALMA
jgi:capsular exopolysaccharide synthesis family protein